MNWYIVGILIYIVIVGGVTVIATRRIKSVSDFMVAGRKLGWWFLFPIFSSLWFGGGTLIGGAGTVFDCGVWSTEYAWGVIPDPYGAGLCLFIIALFVMPKLWKTRQETLFDHWYSRLGRKTTLGMMIIHVFAWVLWIGTQVTVIGKVAMVITGWPMVSCIWLGGIIVMAYTFAGGLWSVAFTDFAQFIIIVISVILAVPFALRGIGGWSEFTANIDPGLLHFFPTHVEGISTFHSWWAWIAAWMIIGLGSCFAPDVVQASYGAKSEKDVKSALMGAGVWYWVFGSIVVLVGLIGAAMFSKGLILEGELMIGGEYDPELILPVMVGKFFPLPLAILFLGGLLASVMSCADGALLAGSSYLSKNVVKEWIKRDITDKGLLWWTRIFVLVLAIGATAVSLYFPHIYYLLMFSFDVPLAALVVPLFVGLHWKKANGIGCISGAIVGLLFRIVVPGIIEGWAFETVTYPASWYIYTIGAPVINFVVMAIVSLATQKINPPMPLVDAEGKPIE